MFCIIHGVKLEFKRKQTFCVITINSILFHENFRNNALNLSDKSCGTGLSSIFLHNPRTGSSVNMQELLQLYHRNQLHQGYLYHLQLFVMFRVFYHSFFIFACLLAAISHSCVNTHFRQYYHLQKNPHTYQS